MPRDLTMEAPPPSSPPVPLTESPNSVGTEHSDSPSASPSFVLVPPGRRYGKAPSPAFHPYTRPLTISDLESVCALENAAFENPKERASREKLTYRLSKCGELCYGLFCTVVPNPDIKTPTLATGKPVETSRPDDAVSVLVGHVISAKTGTPVVTDASMGFPENWRDPHVAGGPDAERIGHQEWGRTIALHSVALLPEYQGKGLGRILMLSYMQHMNGAAIADRLALIAHDHKVGWYEKLGFVNKGKSDAQFGGGGWYDMVFDLKTHEARTAYG